MSTLDIEKVKKNLVSDEILEILKRGKIKAHSGLASPLSSQASCLNFWYPYTNDSLLRRRTDSLLRD